MALRRGAVGTLAGAPWTGSAPLSSSPPWPTTLPNQACSRILWSDASALSNGVAGLVHPSWKADPPVERSELASLLGKPRGEPVLIQGCRGIGGHAAVQHMGDQISGCDATHQRPEHPFGRKRIKQTSRVADHEPSGVRGSRGQTPRHISTLRRANRHQAAQLGWQPIGMRPRSVRRNQRPCVQSGLHRRGPGPPIGVTDQFRVRITAGPTSRGIAVSRNQPRRLPDPCDAKPAREPTGTPRRINDDPAAYGPGIRHRTKLTPSPRLHLTNRAGLMHLHAQLHRMLQQELMESCPGNLVTEPSAMLVAPVWPETPLPGPVDPNPGMASANRHCQTDPRSQAGAGSARRRDATSRPADPHRRPRARTAARGAHAARR